MFPKLLLSALSLLPAVWAETSPIADCAKVGEKNVGTIKRIIKKDNKDVDFQKEGDEEEVVEAVEGEESKDPAAINVFADKMSCLDAPSGKKFGYPGYDLKNVDKVECFARLLAPALDNITWSPDKPVGGITWDPSACGKRVWSYDVIEEVKGPGGTAENVHFVLIYDFDDAGKIVAISTFTDTLAQKSVGEKKVPDKEEKMLEKDLEKDLEQKWSVGEALGVEDRSHGGRFLDVAAGLLMGVTGMALAGRLRRSSAPPVGYQAA